MTAGGVATRVSRYPYCQRANDNRNLTQKAEASRGEGSVFESSHGQGARSANGPEQANEKAASLVQGRVEERSPALSGANRALAEEITERERSEVSLRKRETRANAAKQKLLDAIEEHPRRVHPVRRRRTVRSLQSEIPGFLSADRPDDGAGRQAGGRSPDRLRTRRDRRRRHRAQARRGAKDNWPLPGRR